MEHYFRKVQTYTNPDIERHLAFDPARAAHDHDPEQPQMTLELWHETMQRNLRYKSHSTVRCHTAVFDFFVKQGATYFDWEGIYKFTCLRNPYERMVSYYLNQVVPKHGRIRERAHDVVVQHKHEPSPPRFADWMRSIYQGQPKDPSSCPEVKHPLDAPHQKDRYSKLHKNSKNLYNFYLQDFDGNINIDYYLDFGRFNKSLKEMLDHMRDSPKLKQQKRMSKNGDMFQKLRINTKKVNNSRTPARHYERFWNTETLRIFETNNKKDIELYQKVFPHYDVGPRTS